MNKKHKARKSARDVREEQQAKRVVNGIFVGLIALMVLSLVAYYVWQS